MLAQRYRDASEYTRDRRKAIRRVGRQKEFFFRRDAMTESG